MKVFASFVFLYLLDVIVPSQGSNALAPYYIKTSFINCYGNPDLLVNITCKLKPKNWEKTLATMDSDLVGVIRNASLHLEVFKFTNQFRPFLVNITLNLCKMLETGKGNAYGKTVVKIFSHFTSINHSCPYEGHLAAHGIYLDTSFIPFFIPSAKYKLVLTFNEGWPFVHIGTVEIIGIVAERNVMGRNNPRSGSKRNLLAKKLHVDGYSIYKIPEDRLK